MTIDFFSKGVVRPVIGFAIIFVSYEGFQLLVYDYEDIDNVERTLPIGMYVAIVIAMLIYARRVLSPTDRLRGCLQQFLGS